MSDGAMSRDAMLASLPDLRLPEVSTVEFISELAAAIGLAALAALFVVALARAAGSRRRVTDAAPTIAQRRQASLSLPAPARRIALLHLLRDAAPERHAALQPRLYRPDAVGLKEIEQEVAKLA